MPAAVAPALPPPLSFRAPQARLEKNQCRAPAEYDVEDALAL